MKQLILLCRRLQSYRPVAAAVSTFVRVTGLVPAPSVNRNEQFSLRITTKDLQQKYLDSSITPRALNIMSAYHWEARRRQHVLDQRRVNLTNVTKNTIQSPGHSSKQMKNTKENCKTMPDKYCKHCKHCTQGTHNPLPTSEDDYSAKMKNRYNSVQYNQQW